MARKAIKKSKKVAKTSFDSKIFAAVAEFITLLRDRNLNTVAMTAGERSILDWFSRYNLTNQTSEFFQVLAANKKLVADIVKGPSVKEQRAIQAQIQSTVDLTK